MSEKIPFKDQIDQVNKLELMDKLLDQNNDKITSLVICEVVNELFGFDLTTTPILFKDPNELIIETTSQGIIDWYLDRFEVERKGPEIREMINKVFGINLEAISRLEGKRISLYSKDQWVVRSDQDLFVVYTGAGDVDVKIYPTQLFTDQTGLTSLPDQLSNLLKDLGYYYDTKLQSCYFSNPTGEAVSDQFKGQTMMLISKAIQASYSHL